jgi:hypothetical protein
MRKFIKVFLIALASLLAVLLIAAGIVSWLVFTPERVTPIVRKQAARFITCQSEIGEVDLTLFSTWPDVGLRVRRFALINPVAGAPSDTLVNLDELMAVVDGQAWWKRREMILVGLELNGGTVNVFSDSLGNTNYDIVASDTTPSPGNDSATAMPVLDIRNVVLDDVNLRYRDLSSKMDAVIRSLSAKIAGTVGQDSISGRVTLASPGVSFEYGGEKYLEQASVKLDLPVDVVPSRQFIKLKGATISINDLGLWLNGTARNDTLNRNIEANISYKLSAWPVNSMLALVPPSFHSYLEGFEGDGLLTSEGTAKGILSDSVMPLVDVHLLLEGGTVNYAGFPLPLHDVYSDVNIHSDLKTDAISYVRINRLQASTPRSRVEVRGRVDHLFSDIRGDIAADVRLRLDELAPLVPDSLDLELHGTAAGKLKSTFYLSQLENMQLEKMRVSGSATLTNLDVAYDSISLQTDRTTIEFALPNRKPSSNNTRFAFATLLADKLSAGKTGSYDAYLENASITLETSDVRDTTRIPDILCDFRMDSLSAAMDTLSLAVARPMGKVILSPRKIKSDQARIALTYSSGPLETAMGQNTAAVKQINLDADVLNDDSQKDVFRQWLVQGFVDLDHGNITLSGLQDPIEIPSVKMHFEPEKFSIEEASLKTAGSDFQLKGDLNNVLSYFRGDSILRGRFNFVSDLTDVGRIMAMTSGIGNQDNTALEASGGPDPQKGLESLAGPVPQKGLESLAGPVPRNVSDLNEASGPPEAANPHEAAHPDSGYTGPYMVPQGIDVSLTTLINKAVLGIDTATSIKGTVLVDDGILLLDGLTLKTPACRMQLTAMYRTPRKNHLYLGLDYHMLDIEISDLLNMIPDIDTLMPMLRSFAGKAEFHIAIETYLDSLYNIKKSTLRGASAIMGTNLVLLDGETFSEIAKTLRFNKHTENKVDSLSAEFTVFRNEIDVYPFLIVMDKYKAIVGGRHNFDLTFDYNISVIDSPLPFKLGVDVTGNENDLSYKPGKCKYPDFYRPTPRHAVENKQLELKKVIRDALTQKVKE